MSDVPRHDPVPGLDPRAITLDEYREYAPEKFELLGGYLFDEAAFPEYRVKLLRILLVNVGLRAAVALAPEQSWREALESVYGQTRG